IADGIVMQRRGQPSLAFQRLVAAVAQLRERVVREKFRVGALGSHLPRDRLLPLFTTVDAAALIFIGEGTTGTIEAMRCIGLAKTFDDLERNALLPECVQCALDGAAAAGR